MVRIVMERKMKLLKKAFLNINKQTTIRLFFAVGFSPL